MGEIFKTIPEYPEYLIGSEGTIIQLKKVLPARTRKDNYQRVSIIKADGSYKAEYVHRLVMQAFVGASDLHVDHKDFNPKNNRLDNLEYVTPKENTQRSHAAGRSLPNHGARKLTNEQVILIRAAQGSRKTKDLAKEFDVTGVTIRNIWKNITYTN